MSNANKFIVIKMNKGKESKYSKKEKKMFMVCPNVQTVDGYIVQNALKSIIEISP